LHTTMKGGEKEDVNTDKIAFEASILATLMTRLKSKGYACTSFITGDEKMFIEDIGNGFYLLISYDIGCSDTDPEVRRHIERVREYLLIAHRKGGISSARDVLSLTKYEKLINGVWEAIK